jgi:MFS family permease
MVGSLGAGWRLDRWGTSVAYTASIAAMSVALALAAASPNVWLAAVVVIGMGVGNGIAVVANSLLIQRGTPDQQRGRAFTFAMSLTYSLLFVGMMVGGFVSDAIGARWTWALAAAIAAVAALAGYALARGLELAAEPVESEALPVVSGAAPEPAEAIAPRE